MSRGRLSSSSLLTRDMPPISATSQRKQPCNGCRTRKKRCDTARPTCSNCRKWGISCDYTNRTYAAERIFADFGTAGDYTQHVNWPFEQSTGTVVTSNFPLQDVVPAVDFPWQAEQSLAQAGPTIPDIFSGLDTSTQLDLSSDFPLNQPEPVRDVRNPSQENFAALLDCSTKQLDPNANQTSDTQSSDPGSLADTAATSPCPKDRLPALSLLLELVDTYFAHHQIFLPFLHRKKYVQKVESFQHQGPGRQESALLYAIIAIAAVSHPDVAVQNHRLDWFAKAKQLSADTEKKYPSLQEIQTSLCICMLAWTTGDYPLCWMSIGTAWRQAVTLGLNCIDGQRLGVVEEKHLPKCPLEKEEQRRTVWMIFIMDRGMAFPCGWPHAIDDRQFMVNLPVGEDLFQNADEQTSVLDSTVPFSRNLRKIITSPSEGNRTMFQAILKAYMLLGRITEHLHSLEAASDPEEHLCEFQQLDTELSRFKLSLPKAATTLRSVSVQEATHIFWLNSIVGILVVLLHHRPEANACKPPQSSSTANTPVSEPQSIDGFEYCVSAAKGISHMIQDATKISIDALINPHIGSSLYGCGRTLAIHYAETKSEEVRSDIDMYLLLFDRVADVYPTLGTKFRNGMRYTLAQDAEAIRKMKAYGASGMLSRCGDWSGPNPQATLQNLVMTFSR